MQKGVTYILECCDGSFYVGSTKDLSLRFSKHISGNGANYTRERLPIKLVYIELYTRVDLAYDREQQLKGWSKRKKIALIEGRKDDLPNLSKNYADNGSIDDRIENGELPEGI
jgi:putative endonuclease